MVVRDDATYYCSLTDTTLTFDNVKKPDWNHVGSNPHHGLQRCNPNTPQRMDKIPRMGFPHPEDKQGEDTLFLLLLSECVCVLLIYII